MKCLQSILVITFVFLLISCSKGPLEAVNEDTSPYFLKTYGSVNNEAAYTSLTTPEGGCLLAGAVNSYTPNQVMGAYLIKTDSSGNKLWSMTYRDSAAENFTNILATDDGHFVLCGNAYKEKCWINFRKIDQQGNVVSYRQLFKTDSSSFITGLCSDRAGGYLISGLTNSGYSNGTNTAFLAKLDASGNLVWQKFYAQYNYLNFNDVQSLADGTIALTGSFENEACLIVMDYDGFILSLSKYGSGSGECLIVDSQGNYLIGGKKYPGNDSYSGWVIKIAANLNKIWESSISFYGYNTIYSIIENSDNSYSVCGNTGSIETPFIAKLYSNGNFSWQHKIEKDVLAIMSVYTIHPSRNSGYYLSGTIFNGHNQKDDILLIKTDQFGQYRK